VHESIPAFDKPNRNLSCASGPVRSEWSPPRKLSQRLGIRQFAVTPALNDSCLFIAALADLVLRELACPAV
jgi:hypothetical protein